MSKEASPLRTKMVSSQYVDKSMNNGSNAPSATNKVPSSPNHQKLKEMTENFQKMNDKQYKDKQSKVKYIDQAINSLESEVSNYNGSESKFRFFRDELNSLQERLNDGKINRSNLHEKLAKDIVSVEERFKDSADKNQYLSREIETQTHKGLDDKIFNMHVTHSRLNKGIEEEFNHKVEEIKNFLADIKEGIECEAYQREEGIELLTDQIQKEVKKVNMNLQIENKMRNQTSEKIMDKFTETYNILHDQIQEENQTRTDNSDAILKLLEDTCSKLDRKVLEYY